jgi:prephenate dehydratase
MKLESSKSVAFQGEHGAFSETAIFTLFKKETRTLPRYSFADVFEKVQNGECEYGVLPVENSLGGVVYQVWDCLHEYDLSIVAETKIKITHQLITNPGVKLTDITTVYAHYQVAKFFYICPYVITNTHLITELMKKSRT